MSWKVANLCAGRLFGSPVRKQIIMFMADKASDDGSGIWCSKATTAQQTELGETTVKRAINEFLREGILRDTGRRKCKNGYTVVYQICLETVECLSSADEPAPEATPARADGVPNGRSWGAGTDPQGGPQWPPNHPESILEPPTRAKEIEGVWDAYPADRRRNKEITLDEAAMAVEEGYEVSELIAAVKLYAEESAGFTRAKVSFSDNWFRQRKWEHRVDQVRQDRAEEVVRTKRHYEQVAKWVKERSWMCAHVSERQASEAVSLGYLSLDEALSAGVLR